MRIIAGKNKGKKLFTLPGQQTRPMMDRMKESVFNIIGPFFAGGIVLDLFGGSGALGLEALSRGCEVCHIVEKSSAACRIIEENIKLLQQEENAFLYKNDYEIALNRFKNQGMEFDIVFIDPPYRMTVIPNVLKFLITNNMLRSKADIVCHFEKGAYELNEVAGLNKIKAFSYASNEIVIYKKPPH